MIVCHDETGRITATVNDPVPPGTAEFYRKQGIRFVDVVAVPLAFALADIVSECHVAGRRIVRRPACPATVSLDARRIVIADLPAGSAVTIHIEGVAVPVADTEIDIDEPGPLTVAISPPWPFKGARHDLVVE